MLVLNKRQHLFQTLFVLTSSLNLDLVFNLFGLDTFTLTGDEGVKQLSIHFVDIHKHSISCLQPLHTNASVKLV